MVQGAQQEQGQEDLGQDEWRHLVQAEAGLFFVGTMGMTLPQAELVGTRS